MAGLSCGSIHPILCLLNYPREKFARIEVPVPVIAVQLRPTQPMPAMQNPCSRLSASFCNPCLLLSPTSYTEATDLAVTYVIEVAQGGVANDVASISLLPVAAMQLYVETLRLNGRHAWDDSSRGSHLDPNTVCHGWTCSTTAAGLSSLVQQRSILGNRDRAAAAQAAACAGRAADGNSVDRQIPSFTNIS